MFRLKKCRARRLLQHSEKVEFACCRGRSCEDKLKLLQECGWLASIWQRRFILGGRDNLQHWTCAVRVIGGDREAWDLFFCSGPAPDFTSGRLQVVWVISEVESPSVREVEVIDLF